MDEGSTVRTLEPLVDLAVRTIGSGIEIFGVLVIVIGIAWSTFRSPAGEGETFACKAPSPVLAR